MDPKPYLEYLDKEMTIMGLLSGFAVAITSFATERILSADKGFLSQIAGVGRNHVLAGAASALVAALFFYLQRSHLAWYYGQIALAQSRGTSSPSPVEDWLTWSDGWDTWKYYQTGFSTLTLSLFYYAYAIAGALSSVAGSVTTLYSLWLPMLAMLIVEATRWHVLTKFPQEDRPFQKWVRLLRNRRGE
jgi:hypothetical protein